MIKKEETGLPFPEIPDRHFFRIGEVSDLTGIKPHVLRYWETEFPMLVPPKSRSKQRLYRKNDIELILLLKKLLYEEGFTIAGARSKLQEARFSLSSILVDPAAGLNIDSMSREEMKSLLQSVRQELVVMRQMMHGQTNNSAKTGSA